MQTLDAMTVAEAAELLGQPRRTVADHARQGLIPATKLPGKTGAYLLDRDAVEAMAGEGSPQITGENDVGSEGES